MNKLSFTNLANKCCRVINNVYVFRDVAIISFFSSSDNQKKDDNKDEEREEVR